MTRILRLLLMVIVMLAPGAVQAQFTYTLDESVIVKDADGNTIPMPWAGGLNAPHYNTMDLDHDGHDDLVLFDRTADKIVTFLNRNNAYTYAPRYETFFPAEITNWLLLRDYNGDGKKDIFTGDILGMRIYTNVTTASGTPAWKHFLFYAGPGGTKSTVLLTKGFSGKINLQLQFDDLPAIIDADGDGDLDIFNVRFTGNGTVEYHRNYSKERYNTTDSLDFERITQKWGGFTECTCGSFAFNNEECPPNGGRTEHAGGKSLLALDANADGQLDLLFSEASCNNLYLMQNEGTLDAPVINRAALFPVARPATFQVFPAGFYEDLDFDGKKDLLAIPNVFAKPNLNCDLKRSNWFYKNNGTNEAPQFTFVKPSYLQDQMLDIGDNAVPAFLDYDGDGDLDLFASRHSGDDVAATIVLYENTGTADAPAFTWTTDDVFGMEALALYNLKIQFADINADGKRDLAFSASTLQGSLTRFHYVLNNSATGIDFTGQEIVTTNLTLYITENVSLVDVDSDGLLDALVGKVNGSLEYWRNTGTKDNPRFTQQTTSYLGLGATVLRQNITCATGDLDADGNTDLLLSAQDGTLSVVSDFHNATDATGAASNITFNALKDDYESRNFGGRVWPTIANIFSTNKPAIVLGTTMGGFTVLRNDGGESLPEEPVVHIFPNPVRQGQSVKIRADRSASVQIFSSLGQRLTDPVTLSPNDDNSIVLPFNPGVYIFRFQSNQKMYSRRVVIY